MKSQFGIQLKILKIWLASALLFSYWAPANAADLNLATSPLFLGTSVDPNVFFLLDDSGSMDWGILTIAHNRFDSYWENTSDSSVRITDGLWYSATSKEVCYGWFGGPPCFPSAGIESVYYMYSNSDNLYDQFGSTTVENDPETVDSDWRGVSSDFNVLYYNPEVDYEPWIGLNNAVFTNVDSDPQPGSDGYGRNKDLTGFVYTVWKDDHAYEGNYPDGPSDATDGPNGEVDHWDSHIRYQMTSTELIETVRTVPDAATMEALGLDCDIDDSDDPVPFADCYGTNQTVTSYTGVNPFGRTLTEEKQNIANWYEFARKRSFVAKGAISSVITDQNDFRYGMTMTRNWNSFFIEVPATGVTNYASHNSTLLNSLYTFDWPATSTPLRTGLEVAGKYFDNTISGKTDPIVSQCQQNFTILFTDGYWNGGNPASAIGDADGDGISHTLADVAKYYYDNDLSPLSNNVPTSLIDPNNQQHMVTFGVAYGVKGNLVDTDDDGYPDPELAEDDDWGNPFNNDQAKIDDLWHSAFNSKGIFVEARYPSEVVEAVSETLSEIADRAGSSASVATNSGSLNAGSHLFQARFDSDRWSGQLLAFALNADGSLDPIPDWDARDELETQNPDTGREIITYNPSANSGSGGGIPFRFPSDYRSPDADDDLNTGQLEYLLTDAPYAFDTGSASEKTANQAYGEDILNYFRGERDNESVGKFRIRNFALGDIVDSDPQFVGVPRGRYPDNLEGKPYSAFRSANYTRDPVVYVGANDGMLHAFLEDTGEEILAYVPSAVYENLPSLARNSYTHEYFVNEAPTVVDVFLANTYDPGTSSNGLWITAMVGGLGGGGQGYYALNVTDPDDFDESNADSLVLWEFNDSDDADLGYSYSVPSMAKMANGSWAVIFGNGFNNTEADGNASTTGHAVLYIVDIEDGSIIRKIDTEVGSTGTPNGLSSPALIDTDGDFVVDYAYAGDMEGNMWKFDLSDPVPANWDVAWEDGGSPQPLFTTLPDQPITTRPQIAFHPDNLDGYMVYFGTGKYLEINDDDPTGTTTQTFYGIWDKGLDPLTPSNRSDLLEQSILNQFGQGFDTTGDAVEDAFFNLRELSDNAIDFSTHMGWYIDLIPDNIDGSANSSNFGEKQVSNALLRDGRVIFTTLLPSQGLCDFGGSSFVMQVDFRSGGALPFPAFDLNGDGEFNDTDTLASGKQSDVGIVPTLSILLDDETEVAYGSGSSGDIDVIDLNPGALAFGRQSWRQLR